MRRDGIQPEIGRGGGALVEVVSTFKYLRRPLDQKDNDWPEIRKNIKLERTVWERLRKLLRLKFVDPRVALMFYRTLAQAALIFGLETWLLFTRMEKKVEGTYKVFLRQIMVKWSRNKADRRWETLRAEVVWDVAATQ